MLKRMFLVVALFSVLGPLATQASAATRLFIAISGGGQIVEINPATGAQIASFATTGFGANPGLAFNGTELFYTDDSLTTIHVFSTAGALLRQLPKPADKGSGMGVSSTSLFVVGSDDSIIVAISPSDGAVQSSFFVDGAKQALTYAGSRGTVYVRLADESIAESALDGTIVNTFPMPVVLAGLGFSSSANVLFGVVSGQLYAMNPDTGAVLAGYPIQIKDAQGNPQNFTGGAAADEIAPPPPAARVTRGATFWKQYPKVIDGSFDGPGGKGTLLPIDICGLRLDRPCEAVLGLSLPGNGLLGFAREAIAATLNCKAFQTCTPDVIDVIKAGSEACRRGRRFDYSSAANALRAFNRSGEALALPFDPGRAQPLACFLRR